MKVIASCAVLARARARNRSIQSGPECFGLLDWELRAQPPSSNAFHMAFEHNPPVTQAASALPQMQGSGLVRDLREATAGRGRSNFRYKYDSTMCSIHRGRKHERLVTDGRMPVNSRSCLPSFCYEDITELHLPLHDSKIMPALCGKFSRKHPKGQTI